MDKLNQEETKNKATKVTSTTNNKYYIYFIKNDI